MIQDDDFSKRFRKLRKELRNMSYKIVGKDDNKMDEDYKTFFKNDVNEKLDLKNKIGIASPWVIYYHKLNALFGKDPDIRLDYNDETKTVKMYVTGTEKADAIQKLLPEGVFFGGVELKIVVIPANKDVEERRIDLIEKALKGNPIFDEIIHVDSIFSNDLSYVMFKREVAQFFNDNLGDPHGNASYLYADLARDIFGTTEGDGVMFSTADHD